LNLLNTIRKNPLQYLPEISLTAFRKFHTGYWLRCSLEGRRLEDDVDNQEFDLCVRRRFGVDRAYFNLMTIIGSFAANDAEAFHDYFSLRDEFLSTAPSEVNATQTLIAIEHLNLVQLLKKIRERPPLYLGDTCFRSLYLTLMGDERAFLDLGLPQGDDRRIFSEFKSWVEREKNEAGRPRPWHVIISYYGIGGDCGHTKLGALTLSYEWLDEFASEIGQPDLFQVLVN
jgi:hypothetical protein